MLTIMKNDTNFGVQIDVFGIICFLNWLDREGFKHNTFTLKGCVMLATPQLFYFGLRYHRTT